MYGSNQAHTQKERQTGRHKTSLPEVRDEEHEPRKKKKERKERNKSGQVRKKERENSRVSPIPSPVFSFSFLSRSALTHRRRQADRQTDRDLPASYLATANRSHPSEGEGPSRVNFPSLPFPNPTKEKRERKKEIRDLSPNPLLSACLPVCTCAMNDCRHTIIS
mmetsp:Transcript_25207/g.49242  ORF Transcript_25207/g.49242 Transcript_25207/m.49242 type:complete len:164 (-) Transcript_25207:3443-3934(-)